MQSNRLMVVLAAATMGLVCAGNLYSSDESVEITGVVTNSVSGEPVARAHISLIGGALRQNHVGTTGADGKFSIARVPPGSYGVRVDRVGFTMLRISDGGNRNQIRIQPGDQTPELSLKLVPWGSISGRVLDAHGEPLADATVYAERSRGGHQSDTDEKGRFRIGRLLPGKYRLRVTIEDESLPPEIRTDGTTETRYATTYYPGSLDGRSAAQVEVQPGSEVPGIEVRMIGVPVVGVLGKVIGIPPGAENVTVSIGVGRSEPVSAEGSFALWRLDPGHYSLSASGQTPSGRDFQTDWVDIEVGGSNVDHIELRVVPAAPLTGRLEFEDETAKQILHPAAASKSPSGTPAQLLLEDLRGNSGDNVTLIGSDDSFQLKDVTPGRYRVRLIDDDGAYVKSMQFAQAQIEGTTLDLSHGVTAPSELILSVSSATGKVSGIVRDQAGSPAAGINVALADGEDEHNDIESTLVTETGAGGAYSFSALQPGKYRLAVADAADLEQLMDDESGEAIDIQAGETMSKDLTLPH